jgi:hypothetical protein
VRDGVALVGGKVAGQTHVVIEYAHPTDDSRETARVAVRVIQAKHNVLAVGVPTQADPEVLSVLTGVKASNGAEATYACHFIGEGDAIMERFEAADLTKGDRYMFHCVAPLEMSSGRSYLDPRPLEAEDSVYLCQHSPPRSEPVAGMMIYRGTVTGPFTLMETRGDSSDLCGVKR